MTDYTQITNFTAKDSLTTGNPAKKILGAGLDPEFSAIATAVSSKYDSADVADNATAAAMSSDATLLTPAKLLYALQNPSVLYSALTALAGSGVAATADLLAIYDASASVLKSITINELLATPSLTANIATTGTFSAGATTLTGLTLTTALAVLQGGTGSTTASGARTNLGLIIGTDVLAPTGSGTGLSGVLMTANNLSEVTAATARTNLGLGTMAVQNSSAVSVTGGVLATTVSAVTFSATAMTVDCSLSNVFTTTFTANVTTAPTFSNPLDGQTIRWFITQDGTGARTMTWPSSFKAQIGTSPLLSVGANAIDLVVATYRSSNTTWYFEIQRNFGTPASQAWAAQSRALDTGYTNQTGQEIAVCAQITTPGSSSTQAWIDGVQVSFWGSMVAGTTTFTHSFVVPNGSSYGVYTSSGSPSLSAWYEKR